MRIDCTDGRYCLYQWDLNQRLIIEEDVPVGTQVHFAASAFPEDADAPVVESYEADGTLYANIPNKYLQRAGRITAYVYPEVANDRHTAYALALTVKPRKKPADYIYAETEVKSYEDFRARLTTLETDKADLADIPKVFPWAVAELPFDETTVSDYVINTTGQNPGGFVINPVGYEDGKPYFQYHAGAKSFTWTNPSPQKGAVTITVKGIEQYGGTGNTRLRTYYDDGTEGESLYIIVNHESRTVTWTSDPEKTLVKITGNYDLEGYVLLDMDVLSIVADYPIPSDLGLTGATVGQTVKITEVDENGKPVKWEAVEMASGGGGVPTLKMSEIVETITEKVFVGWWEEMEKQIFPVEKIPEGFSIVLNDMFGTLNGAARYYSNGSEISQVGSYNYTDEYDEECQTHPDPIWRKSTFLLVSKFQKENGDIDIGIRHDNGFDRIIYRAGNDPEWQYAVYNYVHGMQGVGYLFDSNPDIGNPYPNVLN